MSNMIMNTGYLQVFTLKKYPAQLSLTTWMNWIAAVQSAAFTVILQHKREEWIITYQNDLWSILYAVSKYYGNTEALQVLVCKSCPKPCMIKQQGVVCSGLTIFIQLWCTKQKGPVFVTIFNPLSTLFVVILAYFFLGEILHVGR